jgi:hypothetical protein
MYSPTSTSISATPGCCSPCWSGPSTPSAWPGDRRRAPDADARRNDRRRPRRPAPGLSWEMAQGRHINVYLGSLASLAYVGIFPAFSATSSTTAAWRSGRQQGQPVHSPDAGFRHPVVGHFPRRNPALVSLPRHRPDLQRYLADDEKIMGLFDWLSSSRSTAISDALWAKTLATLPFIEHLAVDEKKSLKLLVEQLPCRKGIQYRRRAATERRNLRFDCRPGLPAHPQILGLRLSRLGRHRGLSQ